MARTLATIAYFVCLIWLLFFTGISPLQNMLLIGVLIAGLIQSMLE